MEAPEAYKTAALMNLIGGAINILFGLAWIWLCVGIIPLGAGAFQIFVWLKMKDGAPHPQAKMSLIVGIVGGIFGFNIFGIAASAFGFMNITKPETVAFLEG